MKSLRILAIVSLVVLGICLMISFDHPTGIVEVDGEDIDLDDISGLSVTASMMGIALAIVALIKSNQALSASKNQSGNGPTPI